MFRNSDNTHNWVCVCVECVDGGGGGGWWWVGWWWVVVVVVVVVVGGVVVVVVVVGGVVVGLGVGVMGVGKYQALFVGSMEGG